MEAETLEEAASGSVSLDDFQPNGMCAATVGSGQEEAHDGAAGTGLSTGTRTA